jgi:hypothetical protein
MKVLPKPKKEKKEIKIKVDIMRNKNSVKEKDGGGPRYVTIDRICTAKKEIFNKIVQVYFSGSNLIL